MNTNLKLSEVLDVEPINEPEKTTEIVVNDVPVPTNSVVETDTDFARKNIINLIEKGNVAIDNLLDVARQSEHPRAYEVAAGLIKNLSELNKDLLEIQKRKKDLIPASSENKGNINVDKAVFIGSTTELLKQLYKGK
jgi:hypothetical protein